MTLKWRKKNAKDEVNLVVKAINKSIALEKEAPHDISFTSAVVYGHFFSTSVLPVSSYSARLTHICWNAPWNFHIYLYIKLPHNF